MIIVSRYDSNPPRALVIYVPVTTQNRGSFYEVELPLVSFLTQGSVANVQGIGSVPRVRLERKLGELPTEAMVEIKQALVFALDLETDMENEE